MVFARGHAARFTAEALEAAGTRARAEVHTAKAAKAIAEVAAVSLAAAIAKISPPSSPPSPITTYLAVDAAAATQRMPGAVCFQLVSALQGAIERDFKLAAQLPSSSEDHEVPASSPRGAEELASRLSSRKAAASARAAAECAETTEQGASISVSDTANTGNISVSRSILQTTIARLAIRASQAAVGASKNCREAYETAVHAEAKLRRCVKISN